MNRSFRSRLGYLPYVTALALAPACGHKTVDEVSPSYTSSMQARSSSSRMARGAGASKTIG